MKSILIILLISLSAFLPTYAQLPDGSIAPDFTLQDINGNSHHLYEYLDSGKVVIIDFFEVMCRPCWEYHETHNLAKAYNAWGPGGTNELMIFEIEGIKSSVEKIRGQASGTYGDWTAGEPFPFIATCAPNTDQVVKDYKIGFFPSVYMICRDRRTKLIGTLDTAAIHSKMHQCPNAPADSLFMDLVSIDSVSKVGCTDVVHPYLKLQNYGAQSIFSAKIDASVDNSPPQTIDWTGHLTTYDILEFDGTTFTQLSDGSHNFSYLINSINGYTQGFRRDTIRFRVTVAKNWPGLPFTENFEESQFPYNRWTIDNNYPTVPTWERADLDYAKALRIPYYNIDPSYLSSVYLPGLSFAGIVNASLRFDLACIHNNSVLRKGGYDLISVAYSLDCVKTLTSLANISEIENQTAPDDSNYFVPTESQWKPIDIDLSKLSGKENVFLCFQSGPAFGNNMYVKNLRIINTTGVKSDPENLQIHIYPQPAHENLFVKFNLPQEDISLYISDASGRSTRTYSFPNGSIEVALSLTDLPPGCYYLRITTSKFTGMKKVLIY